MMSLKHLVLLCEVSQPLRKFSEACGLKFLDISPSGFGGETNNSIDIREGELKCSLLTF